MVWKQKHSHGDNHYLDCEVYAFAAAEIMGVRELHTLTEGVEKQQEKRKKITLRKKAGLKRTKTG